MRDTYDPRDVEVMTIVGQIDPLGVVVLCALEKMFPEPVKAARLAFMTKVRDIRKTLQPVLDAIEQCGYATRTGSKASESWRITDIGRIIIRNLIASTAASTPALPSASQPAQPIALPFENGGDNLSVSSSSSSDLSDQSVSDSDQIRIEEEEEKAFKEFLCKFYGFTGAKATTLAGTKSIYGEDICAWMYEVRQMQGRGFKFRKSPESYALACLLNGDAPSSTALHASKPTVDQQWTIFCEKQED